MNNGQSRRGVSIGATRSKVRFIASVLLFSLTIVVTPATASNNSARSPQYYLSLGDSIAVGIQPGFSNGVETLRGFSNKVVTDLAPKYKLVLRNFACGGETTFQMMSSIGCPSGSVALNAVSYPSRSQLAAAVSFIHAHPGHIALITISIGFNDLDQNESLNTVQANIQRIALQLRTASGSQVPIMALNYDDYQLANWLIDADGKVTALDSVAKYRYVINPMLVAAYARTKVDIVDVSTAFGTAIPFSQVTNLAPYGVVPQAVARLCMLTWNCSQANEHFTDSGYSLVASLISTQFRAMMASKRTVAKG